MPSVKVVFGAHAIGDPADPLTGFATPEAAQSALNICRKHGCTIIDSARGHPPHVPHTSEPLLGQTDVATWATIDSKVDSVYPGDHSADRIAASIDAILKDLNVPSVNVLYLHIPDRSVPLKETLQALDTAHKAGKFKELGISNYEPDEVLDILHLCRTNNYLPPTVYQGQYNAIVRSITPTLLPILRAHNIRLYAWSPGCAGFFHRGARHRHTSNSRIGQALSSIYSKPSFTHALENFHAAADRAGGVEGHEVALRWLRFHSELSGEAGDGIVFGARTEAQVEGSLTALEKGPLSEELVAAVERCFEEVKGDVPYFNPFRDDEKAWARS
ncbi:uncharacterized protein HMPREF1541_03636 [Cyphellophora europaea CBS 101466]|uniref:NADP-dependent oxidoreductase domain-containing protein n=1 Tax=Cyphellophora europaea (strain CBS 101466) TaxID=1220924 RepID=W2RZE0_CYPE1|nr:uncharacterized protein HMPREF1541_03636 [Cyphellophora europaea CBS 101466]ETN41700.1 hypothetical protein HMPREF1541_03636 [Cyphellophora europaea CBS 101466]